MKPDPLNGFSGNQWSLYRLRKISMRQSRNFESCDSETLRRPNLMRWTRKLLAERSSSFMLLDSFLLNLVALNAVVQLLHLACQLGSEVTLERRSMETDSIFFSLFKISSLMPEETPRAAFFLFGYSLSVCTSPCFLDGWLCCSASPVRPPLLTTFRL